jgi:hypothetical protein
MSPVADGPIKKRTVVVHDRIEPPLVAGEYEVRASQAISGSSSLGAIPDDLRHIRVTGPRYRLAGTEILSTFPPANGDGPFVTRLPQIAIRRRTLPWERANGPQRPWLALVLLTDGEGTYLPSVPVASAVTAGVRLDGANPDGPTCAAIEVPARVVRQVFPARQDLPFTCHVRQVPLDDTELAQGDEDGWVAVVLATRLPRPDMRYRACLVSLEGQWSELPDNPPTETGISKTSVYDRLSADDLAMARQPRTDGVPLAVGARARSAVELGGGLAPKLAKDGVDREIIEHEIPPASTGHTAADAWGGAAPAASAGAAVGAAISSGSVILDVDLTLIDPGARLLRFPVLTSWEFRCEGDKDFAALVQGLDVGLLGTAQNPGRGSTDRTPVVSDTGHIVLDGRVRTGEDGRSWYRGPFVPRAVDRRPAEAVHVADQLRRLAEDGRIELGEAAAFELGRLLALSAPSTVAALREWRRQGFVNRRGARVGAGSLLGGLLQHWEVALSGPVGQVLGSRLLTTVGAPEVAEKALPARDAVNPLPDLELLADPARTVATGLGVPVADVRTSFGGVERPPVTLDQLAPATESGFDRLRRDPELLKPVSTQLETTVEVLSAYARRFAPEPVAPHGAAAAEPAPPAEAGDSVEALFEGARPGSGAPEPDQPKRRRRR